MRFWWLVLLVVLVLVGMAWLLWQGVWVIGTGWPFAVGGGDAGDIKKVMYEAAGTRVGLPFEPYLLVVRWHYKVPTKEKLTVWQNRNGKVVFGCKWIASGKLWILGVYTSREVEDLNRSVGYCLMRMATGDDVNAETIQFRSQQLDILLSSMRPLFSFSK